MYKLKRKLYEAMGTPFYNITSSSQYHYAWFRIAKNGTRSVLKALEEKTTLDINGSHIPYFSMRFKNHFKFCFIRNPWDRAVSCYFSKVAQRKMFEECWGKDFDFFVQFLSQQNLMKADRHIQLQTSLFPVNDINYVARFENFNHDFNYIVNEKLKLQVGLQHQNESEHKPYQEYYSNKTRKLIATLYQSDIDFGKYMFS